MKEPEVVGILRLVKKLEDRAIELFNSGKPASYHVVYDALLHVSEYINGELGIYLTEDGGWERIGEGNERVQG